MANTKGMIKEAKSINLSLHFLEQVIISLRDQTLQIKQQQLQQLNGGSTATTPNGSNSGSAKVVTRSSFIPYRNSVLTNMLRDSLGGNCRSCFIMTITPEVMHFEETVATCRFGQRCGEVKVEITANSEVGLSDQLKVLTVKVRSLEKQLASIEDEKRRIAIELNKEHELRVRQTQSRSLTPQEQLSCKTCVQELLAAAKESIVLASAAAGTGAGSEEEAAAQAEELIEASHDKLFDTVEGMDKSVLVELSTALGGLVQSMFIDRETTKQRMQAEERQRRQAADEAVARANLDKRATEQILAGNFNQLESSSILPEVLRSMVLKGAIFIKYNRLGMKDVRNMIVSDDLLFLTWRPLVNSKNKTDKDQGSHPLQFFERYVYASPLIQQYEVMNKISLFFAQRRTRTKSTHATQPTRQARAKGRYFRVCGRQYRCGERARSPAVGRGIAFPHQTRKLVTIQTRSAANKSTVYRYFLLSVSFVTHLYFKAVHRRFSFS